MGGGGGRGEEEEACLWPLQLEAFHLGEGTASAGAESGMRSKSGRGLPKYPNGCVINRR